MADTPKTTTPVQRSFRHTVRRDPGAKPVLEVEVDADRLTRQTDRVFERHNQKARIAGFRPGKAPRAMYERQYGSEHLWAEAAEDVIDETYREIVDLEELAPIDNPVVDVGTLEAGKPLTYTATVVVRPDVELGDYTEHGATVTPKPPADEEIDKTITDMREAHAELRSIDRAAQSGDILTVDIDVTIDGKQMPPFARNAHVEAGRETGIAGLGEAFVGMKANETKTVDLTFPEDSTDETLRGKTGTFSIRPSQVAEKIVPPLDDDFAKTVGVASVDELRKAVRNELVHAAFHEARDDAADKAMEHALATANVEVPPILVDDEVEHMLADLRARVREQGLTIEQFLLQARKTEDEIKQEWRPAAERRAKAKIPASVVFQTKPELGVELVEQATGWDIAAAPVLGDAAYGDNTSLRDRLDQAGSAYGLAVRTAPVFPPPTGCARPSPTRPWAP